MIVPSCRYGDHRAVGAPLEHSRRAGRGLHVGRHLGGDIAVSQPDAGGQEDHLSHGRGLKVEHQHDFDVDRLQDTAQVGWHRDALNENASEPGLVHANVEVSALIRGEDWHAERVSEALRRTRQPRAVLDRDGSADEERLIRLTTDHRHDRRSCIRRTNWARRGRRRRAVTAEEAEHRNGKRVACIHDTNLIATLRHRSLKFRTPGGSASAWTDSIASE